MRTRTLHLLAALVAGLLAVPLAACGGDGEAGGDSFMVGLLLPNRVTPRWERSDKPLIEQHLRELCPECTMVYANAENDAARQREQITSMITKGVKVLILDPADSKALRSPIQEARRAGVPVVAYDRLAEGPISGFVSFDGDQVGKLQGEAILKAMRERVNGRTVVMMNGDPSSANAAWFRKGALSVIAGKAKIARSYDTVGWSPENANANMTAAIAALGADRISGVVAANDAIAAGVVSAFKKAGVRKLPGHRAGRRPRGRAAHRRRRAVHDGVQAVREGGRRGRRHGRRPRQRRGGRRGLDDDHRQPDARGHPVHPAHSESGDGRQPQADPRRRRPLHHPTDLHAQAPLRLCRARPHRVSRAGRRDGPGAAWR